MKELKKIISLFTKIEAGKINNNTLIDKSAIQGSIMIHRMYSEINKLGYLIDDYQNIKTYGELISKLNDKNKISTVSADNNLDEITEENEPSIGIDMEKIDNFPKTTDFREDMFYKQNFSEKEISYCILQKNPIESFAGKFSAKEAVVKADNNYKNIPFNQIEILNDDKGKPFFEGFEISISHNNNLSIAVAVKDNSFQKDHFINTNDENLNKEIRRLKSKFRLLVLLLFILTGIFIYTFIRFML